ncbi:sucrose transport protein SUC3 isoform X2 [Hevea brasiliensis]|uniref:sucrose transport protein SUC3 isoform X2 n=1 Tax=Hevea brasiliensis TaxID=3981 RepID=UPI0025F3BFAD|nr:sucrose transport protein SUC3 isoform X2 [Hevea brasiliensis]
MDSVSIRVPYRNLKKEVEVEMVGVEEQHLHPIQLDNSSSSSSPNSPSQIPNGDSSFSARSKTTKYFSLITLILSCTVAAGVQFGWALQLSLLTPYIQTLGIKHAFSSFIWLCGPITGLVIQPCVGIWSDKCSSKFGRRRPFILAGSLMISVAVIIIGFSADIGYMLGDTEEHCSTFKGTRTRAAVVFVIGFWLLDLANNTVQGPARALLADLSGPDQRNSANAVFCSWMAVGNILGFSAGASGSWNRWFPSLMSRACCEACGNLKAAFLVAVVFLTLCTLVTLYFAKEVPIIASQSHRLSDSAPLLDDPQQNGLELSKSKSDLSILSNSNKNNINKGIEQNASPKHGIANSIEDQNESLDDEPGAVLVNLLTSLRHLPPGMHSVLAVMALTWLSWFPFFLFDTDWMGREVYHGDPKGNSDEVKLYDQGVREGAFGLLLNSITYSVPFSVTAELTADSGGGQGLAIGVLNLAIVIPQMIISLGAGPWDALFGGGNIPAFALASICALAAGVIATLKLPNLSSSSFKSSGFHFG